MKATGPEALATLVAGAMLLWVFVPGVAAGGGEHAEHGHGGFSPTALIEPMGIATLSLVAVTVCLGLFRRANPKVMLKWHKRLGPIALLSGAVHAMLVMLAH